MPLSRSNNTPMPNTYLITGASSGIGRGVANALGRERQRVALVGRDSARLARVAREVVMFGGEALAVPSDVRDPAFVQAALGTILAQWGRVDTALLSSGIAESVDLEAFKSDDVEQIFATNVFGVTHWLEALHPVMRAQPGGGTIAVVSSLSADRAIPGGGLFRVQSRHFAALRRPARAVEGAKYPPGYRRARLCAHAHAGRHDLDARVSQCGAERRCYPGRLEAGAKHYPLPVDGLADNGSHPPPAPRRPGLAVPAQPLTRPAPRREPVFAPVRMLEQETQRTPITEESLCPLPARSPVP